MHSKLRGAPVLLSVLLAASMLASQVAAAEATGAAGDAEVGKRTFNRTCRVCHQVEAGAGSSLGPNLAGLADHAALVDSTYTYSDALKAAAGKGLVWDSTTLDRFLSGPAKMIPGSRMPLSVADATQRGDIVAYLGTLKP